MSAQAPPMPSITSTTTTSASTTEEQVSMYQIRLQPRAHVTFAANVIDNEHLGRKKSKSRSIFLLINLPIVSEMLIYIS